MIPRSSFSANPKFRFSFGSFIAYLHLPPSKDVHDHLGLFQQLQGIQTWELESGQGVYLSLEPWMTKRMVQHLYIALRNYFGPNVRFGAAAQKTTARAAALYRSVPHCAIITPETTESFLAQLPIRLLPGLGQRTVRYLERQGIQTFDAFRNLSAQTLKEWFGVSGLILQQFARGIDPRVVEPRSRLMYA